MDETGINWNSESAAPIAADPDSAGIRTPQRAEITGGQEAAYKTHTTLIGWLR